MKNIHLKLSYYRVLTGFILAVVICLTSSSVAFASFEEAREFAGKTLDGVENAVINSGLVDIKKKLWEEHNLLIKPFIRFGYELSDNVYHAPDYSNPITKNENTDNVWTITPGFNFLFKHALGVIGGAYEATFKYFTKYSEHNTQDQKFLIYANIFPTDSSYIRISESLNQQGVIGARPGKKPIDYLDNTVNIVMGNRVGDFTYEVGYENFDRDFSNHEAKRFSRNENKIDGRVYYHLNDRSRVYTGARVGWADYDKSTHRNVTYWEIPVGYEGDLPLDVTVKASVGAHYRNYKNENRNDFAFVVTNVALNRLFFENRTSVTAGFLRRPVESTFSIATFYDEKLWYAKVKHLVHPKLRLRGGLGLGNRDWEEAAPTGHVFSVGGIAFFSTPPGTVKRSDDFFYANAGIDYQPRKWLVFSVDYRYEYRDSNFDHPRNAFDSLEGGLLDYHENSLSVKTTIPL